MQANILFVHTGNETFVNLDREILSEFFMVQNFHVDRKFPFDFIRYWRGVWNSDLVFCWFAGWNSFWALVIAKLIRKPALLVIGGYDVANLPESDYGHQRGGVERLISRWAMRMSSLLLPFSNYSQQEAMSNAGISNERMRVVYLGVPDAFRELSPRPRQRMALTVGKVEWPNMKRKGLQPFVKSAALLPDVQFVLIGNWEDDSINYLRSIAAPNVLFTGRVSDKELLAYYRRASVYVQASLHEGFGLSVAESMLAGCAPVVTKAGSLPEVVGDCGFYCDSVDPHAIAQGIQVCLKTTSSERKRIRERILERFPIENRRRSLIQAIQDCRIATNH